MSAFREPVFDLETLTNSDTVITWLNRTNQLINGLNSLYVVDIFDGDGICTTRADGVVTINIDNGPGLGFTAGNELTIKFDAIDELTSASTVSPTLGTDYALVERSGVIKKVKLDSFLPPTLKHTHTFEQSLSIQGQQLTLASSQSVIGNSANNWFAVLKANGNTVGESSNAYIKFGGFNNSWFVGTNFTFENNYGIFSNYVTESNTQANFNFCTQDLPGSNLSTNDDDLSVSILSLNFNVGAAPTDWKYGAIGETATTTWPATWKLKFAESLAGFYFYDADSTDLDQPILTMQKLAAYDNLINVNGRIYITDIQNSSQFISSPSGANKVVLTGSDGQVNKKFTNRIVTTDYVSLSEGDVVYVGTITDGDITYAKAQASPAGNYDIVGIVESVIGGQATIVLNGEFEFNSITSLEPGIKYYLSQSTAGDFVEEGTYSSGIIKPVFVAISDKKGVLITSFTPENANIDQITIFNSSDSSTESLEIDQPNYNLTLVGGQNIKLDINTDNEIEIRVEGLAGAQDTFKTIQVNGVGSDGDGQVVSANPNDIISFTSSTLRIVANDTTKTINFEGQNSFSSVIFTDADSAITYTAEVPSDTLQFIAGPGISFTHNTDDSIIITASVTGGVATSNINYDARYQVLASGNTTTASTVSLLGSGTGSFVSNLGSSYDDVSLALEPAKTITYTSGGIYTYDSSSYDVDSGGFWPTDTLGKYLPSELAGFVVGRITPSANSTSVFPSSSIQRLGRNALRFLMGIAPTGYIDNISSVYSKWTIDGGSNYITAADKNGAIFFEAGTGISLSNPGSPNRIVITNTGVAQNAFAKVNIKNKNGTTLDSFDANTSSDNFTLKSGQFISIVTDTNNDTAIFDLNISDDYVLLGNPGTTDGMSAISVSSNSFVGRVGSGPIEAITNSDLAWTTGVGTSTAPSLQMPYFGLIEVGTGGSPTYLNALGANKGKLTFSAGTNISFTANDATNTITINSTGGSTQPTPTIRQIIVGTGGVNTVDANLTSLAFKTGSGLTATGSYDSTAKELTVNYGLSVIGPNTVLANASSIGAVPSPITISPNTFLGRASTGDMQAIPVTGAGTTVRSMLGIGWYSSVGTQNASEPPNTSSSLATNGEVLLFRNTDGTATLTTTSATGTKTIGISAKTILSTDLTPRFATNSSLVSATSFGTTVRYGNETNATTTKPSYYNIESFNSRPSIGGTATSTDIISKEYRFTATNNFAETNLITVTSALASLAGQKYIYNNVITEVVYADAYTLNVKTYNSSSVLQNGAFTALASNITLNSENDIAFSGSGRSVTLNSKQIRSTSNTVDIATSGAYAFMRSVNFNNTATEDFAIIADQNFALTFRSISAGSELTSLYFTDVDDDGTIRISGSEFTTSNKIIFDIDIDFGEVGGTTRTINFANATVTGLSVSTHSDTHRWAQDELFDSNGASAGADALQAWEVGAVARGKPVLLNTIAIANADGKYNFDLNAVATKALLYSGATTYNTTNYSSTITDANRGPLYLVVPNGTDPTAGGSPSGPPGQIIFVRKQP
jgi:hypothetical protein